MSGIDFACNQVGDAACATAGTKGDFAVATSTNTFAQYNGSFGLIKDLVYALNPLNQTFSLPSFIAFDLNNNETVELRFIPLGTDPPGGSCAGLMHCTPQAPQLVTPADPDGRAEFNIDQTGANSVLTFAVSGIVHDSNGDTGTLSGTFTSQFAGMTPQQVTSVLFSGQQFTYSAALNVTSSTSVTTVPEPESIALLGLGFMALALARGKRSPRRN